MTATRQSPDGIATWQFNHLRRGAVYQATTRYGLVTGEYLGMETPYGDRAILLRDERGTESVALTDITAIHPAA